MGEQVRRAAWFYLPGLRSARDTAPCAWRITSPARASPSASNRSKSRCARMGDWIPAPPPSNSRSCALWSCPLRPAERARFDPRRVELHYLKSAMLVGEPLRHVATQRGRWLAWLAWAAPARAVERPRAAAGAAGLWGIESTCHQRLDATLDADRSRCAPPNAAHAPGLFRRLVLSVGHAWLERAQRKNSPLLITPSGDQVTLVRFPG